MAILSTFVAQFLNETTDVLGALREILDNTGFIPYSKVLSQRKGVRRVSKATALNHPVVCGKLEVQLVSLERVAESPAYP